MNRISRVVLFTLIVAASSYARVISYSPYTDRVATPAVQHRLNRHFLLIEQAPTSSGLILSPAPPYGYYPVGQAVLYDASGTEEPRVVFPQDGSTAVITAAAVREDDRQTPAILIQTNANFRGNNPSAQLIWLLSTDGGTSWTKVALPSTAISIPSTIDVGGPFVRGRYSQVRIGTREVPFVVGVPGSASATLYGVTADGSANQLAIFPVTTLTQTPLIGRDAEGRRFLVQSSDGIVVIDLNGTRTTLAGNTLRGQAEGWITPDGAAYIQQDVSPGNVTLSYVKNGAITPVAAAWDGPPEVIQPINSSWVFYAVPTVDYAGAWIIRRGGSRPTQLLLHKPSSGLVGQWTDVSAPEVEALHPSASGDKVLIQVHRPRQTIDNLLFKDPALAVWHVGDPAPRGYDELFLSETATKGFVHVDVDRIESGTPFVFDSGIPQQGGGIIISPAPPSAGGSDVVQEWGVVRASLRQVLILPGVGHTIGAYGSNWATDVTLYNPADTPLNLTLAFIPSGVSYNPAATYPPLPWFRQTLAPHEIRVITDIIGSLFQIDNITGTLYIAPETGSGVNVTSRTYNKTPTGTYGFTMNGIDVFSAAGPRFPLTFSGAFEGSNFRTNLMLTDVSGRGADVTASVSGPNGSSAAEAVTFTGPNSGATQFNSVAATLGVSPFDTGALILRPNKGETVASLFVIDNRTNDPTFFPPDIPASVMRVIPAIGHLDGANGSKFRSDLYLFNNSAQPKTLNLQAKLWDLPENPSTLPLTLLPYEARVIRDVLLTAFGKTGIARLRFTSQGSANDTSVRVTSRTYTIDPSGGTYGFLMPPLNSFQSGGAGDTLEILGATLDPHFRTNLGLVDLTGFPGPRPARARIDIIDDAGKSLDSFEISVPSAGGMQINDLFHGRGLPESTRGVLIRVSTIEGMIGAYAAFVDNGTNDSAYVAANLAAKQ